MRWTLTLAFFLATVSLAAASPRVTWRSMTVRSADGRAVCHVHFPQVVGSGADAVVNGQLRALFVPSRQDLDIVARRIPPDDTDDESRTGDLSLLTADLLSIRTTWVAQMYLPGGHLDNPHPFREHVGLTFDLRSGKPVPLAHLFRRDVDWKARLDQALRRHDADMPLPKSYGFRLTADSLVLLHLTDINVGVDDEVSIPYADLRDILDPAGPLSPLLRQR